MKSIRDRAILAILIGCGLRRAEAAILSVSHIQQREGRWAIVDIVGKRDKMRTVPMPSWAKSAVDSWTYSARIEEGFIFRRVNKGGNLMGESITEQAIYNVVVSYAEKLKMKESRRTIFAAHLPNSLIRAAHRLTRYNYLWDTIR